MNQKLNIEAILAFEQPFVRVSLSSGTHLYIPYPTRPQVPYENYRKVFRISQKSIEKELGAVQTSANELAARAAAGEVDPNTAMAQIEVMVARVEGLKKKVCEVWCCCKRPFLSYLFSSRICKRLPRSRLLM